MKKEVLSPSKEAKIDEEKGETNSSSKKVKSEDVMG